MKLRKAIIVALAIAMAASAPLAATGMPVIDISAITTSITNFAQQVQQWNKQIQVWKSDFDRFAAAAKAISSGDYNRIMQGLKSMTSVLSTYSSDFESLDSFMSAALDASSFAQSSAATVAYSWKALASATNMLSDDLAKGVSLDKAVDSMFEITGGSLDVMSAAASSVGGTGSRLLELAIKGEILNAESEQLRGAGDTSKRTLLLKNRDDLKAARTDLISRYNEAVSSGEDAKASQLSLQLSENQTMLDAAEEALEKIAAMQKEIEDSQKELEAEMAEEAKDSGHAAAVALSKHSDRGLNDSFPAGGMPAAI